MNTAENNVYQPPEADLQINTGAGGLNQFKRFSAWGVFGLSIITLGIYQIYWLYTRAKVANNLHESKISPVLLLSLLLLAVVYIPLSFAAALYPENSMLVSIEKILNIPNMIIYIFVLFKLRNRLQNTIGNTISGFFTLFGSVIYLQYKINEAIDNQRKSD